MTDTFPGFISLILVAIMIAFWIRALKRVEIPVNRGMYVVTCVVAIILGVGALLGSPGWLGGLPAGLAIFASTFFLLSVAVGGQKVGDTAIQVGDTIPEFAATNEHGQIFNSTSLAGSPTLIKFFRGHW
jgi:hypothetical protein